MVEILLSVSVLFVMLLLISTWVLAGLYGDAKNEIAELKEKMKQATAEARLEELVKNTNLKDAEKLIEAIKILKDTK